MVTLPPPNSQTPNLTLPFAAGHTPFPTSGLGLGHDPARLAWVGVRSCPLPSPVGLIWGWTMPPSPPVGPNHTPFPCRVRARDHVPFPPPSLGQAMSSFLHEAKPQPLSPPRLSAAGLSFPSCPPPCGWMVLALVSDWDHLRIWPEEQRGHFPSGPLQNKVEHHWSKRKLDSESRTACLIGSTLWRNIFVIYLIFINYSE